MPPALETGDGEPLSTPSLLIPEIRDYQKINAELVALLDRGHPLIKLEGAEGQRLLGSGLAGTWQAVVEVNGQTGPEFASNLNAPGLTIIGRGSTADGAGRGLKDGRVIILGDAGDASGYDQSGGILAITGSTGHRAGLAQSGGILAILGSTGRLLCDRQSGGQFFMTRDHQGLYPGRGRRGGRLINLTDANQLDPADAIAWQSVLELLKPWVNATLLPID